MAINYIIQADIIDIQQDIPGTNDVFLVDTNVWYWMTYTRASQCDRPPQPHQTKHYPDYVKKVLSTKGRLYRCGLSLAELAHIIETSELEIFARSSGTDKRKRKEFRHNFLPERQKVVTEIHTAWGQVKNMALSLDALVDESMTDDLLHRLQSQAVDGYDLLMIHTMVNQGVKQIITDDGDYAVVSGIQIFTCNRNLLALAQQQGKLLTR